MRHPETRAFFSRVRDLARCTETARARSLGPLVKARAFGMTQGEGTKFKLIHCDVLE
jgi:hypothetical protein